MDKYEKAIEYFYNIMRHGRIEDNKQQEVYEIAIEGLGKLKEIQNLVKTE